MLIRTIIYPTDFSPCAMNALDYAVNIARIMQAKLIVVHTEPRLVTGGIDDQERKKDHLESVEGANAKLEEIRTHIRGYDPLLQVKTMLLAGEHVKPVTGLVETENADLIVMGTRGGSEVSKLLLGSYTAQMIEKAGCPVLAIPEKATYNGFSEIVYASNLEDFDRAVIKQVCDLAKLFNSEVTVLNIREEGDVGEDALYEFERRVRETAVYPKLDFIYFEGKNMNKHIQEYSERNKVNMLVMTSRKKSWLGKLFGEGYTETMAYHTHVPLLVFHETDKCLQL